MSRTTEIVTHGWLTKSPPARGLFRPRWRRRWFILRTGSFPNQFVLEYFTDESCRRQKGQINLDECEQIAAPLSVQDRHKFTFNLRTPSRIYYLAADTETEMNKWVTCLCQVCGLKTVEEEAEMYAKPVDENNQPESGENRESDESSPSLSNHLSGPYIPISECFTGKPIRFNEKQESTYCNTSFPFPPKVNWATYPAKRDGSDSESVAVQGGQLSASAPPRPPKKSSSLTTAMSSPQGCNETMKTLSLPSTSRSVFPYDSFEETHDSSSTCSSLHSPPGSAGVLYSNISEISPAFQNPAMLNNLAPQSHLNPLPSPGDPHVQPVSSAPKVDRNLKPDLRKPVESPSYKSNQQQAASTHKYPIKHNSGAMTLPSTKSQRQTASKSGDPFRKPHDSPITLGPTPVQKNKNQTADYISPRFGPAKSSTNTLPSSPRRRVGPALSPHDKKSVFHEYDTARELTYLQIDCKISDGDTKSLSSKVSLHKRSQSASQSEDTGSVEYRLIDHVKTQALNQMLLDREEQLRTNHGSKNLK